MNFETMSKQRKFVLIAAIKHNAAHSNSLDTHRESNSIETRRDSDDKINPPANPPI